MKVVLGVFRSRSAEHNSVHGLARKLAACAASLVVVIGTITVFSAGVLLPSSGPAAAALSCVDNWTGNASTTDWNTATNWSGGVPNSSTDACISGNATVVISDIGGTTSYSASELTVSSGSSLTVGASGDASPVTLSVSSGFENDGTTLAGPSGTGNANLTINGPLTNTGSLTTDGTVTYGNTVTSTITNEGTWTIGTAGSLSVGGSSTFVQSGSGAQLNVLDTTANSMADNGGFAVNGGTICGTGADIHGATPSTNGGNTLAFASSTPAGPACASGLATDQIVLGSGTNLVTGDVPVGYALTATSSTLEPTATLTNDGSIVLDNSQILDNTGGVSFLSSGSIDVPAGGGASTFNVNTFTNTSTGTFTVENTLTVGNTVTSTITNDGTWTVGTAGVFNVNSSSTFVQGGSSAQLTDLDTTANTFNDGGGFAVDGGTICGTAAELHGATPTSNGGDALVFGSSTPAGPACASGLATDQIALGSGTNLLSGNVPAAYTLSILGNATLQIAGTLTNYGSIAIDPGQILLNSSTLSFTNAGSIDVPVNATASTFNVSTFTSTSTGSFSIEGTLTVGNTVTSTITNDGTWTVGTAGVFNVNSSSTFVQGGSSAQLTDLDTTANTFNDGGGFAVDGGTICGTAAELHGATPTSNGGDALVFGSSTPAGPACASGLATDQIALGSGTNLLSGNVPAAYTLSILGNATLQIAGTLTNYGSIAIDPGQILLNSSTLSFTNAGSIDVPVNATASTFNVSTFTSTSTGSFSIEGTLTVGNTVTSTITNDGTWTVGTAGEFNVNSSSTFVQDGVVTDNDVTGNTTTVNNNSFNDTGGFVVDGGTLCGTPPDLHGGTPTSNGGDSLVFGSNPQPGPDCAAAQGEDQITLGSGTNLLTGNVPAGYTLSILGNSTLQVASTLTNNGSIIIDPGQILANSSSVTFTNAGTIDTPTGSSSTFNVTNFDNAAASDFDVEGTLTIGNTVTTAVTNHGTVGVAPGGLVTIGGSSSLANESDGLLAFGMSGANTATTNYGRITGGTISLAGGADPVFDNGFTPSSGEEYFVYSGGTVNGTFATVLHDATADYSHTGEVGLVGGAPATPTTTSVASSTNGTSVYGEGVQLTATVTPSSGSSPSGSVSFFANGILLGSAAVTTSNSVTAASLDVSNLRVGGDSITATYNGDVVFDASTSSAVLQTVNQDPSAVTVSPSPLSPVPNQQETYTVEVTATSPGAGIPTGDVSLTDDGTPIPGCQNLVMGPLGPSFVTCSVTYPATGSHTIVASYAGDTDFTSGTGNDNLTVQPAATTTTVVPSANPGPLGAPITYTATVSVNAPGTGTPTGTVSFLDNGSQPAAGCQNLALPSTAPFQVTCTESYTANASHGIRATYSGDANDAMSFGTLTETLQQVSTTTSVVSSAPTSTFGQSVTFTATVSPSQSASVNPSGTVSFFDNGAVTPIGSGTVSTSAGITTATLQIATLGAGSHAISATYSGDATFTTSSSTTSADLAVGQAATMLSVESSASTSVVGQSVTLSATVASSASGETGTVTFFDNGLTIGTGGVSGGVATLTTSSLALGSHPITASYAGDGNFVGSSTSSDFSQQVDQAATTTTVTSDDNPGTVGQPVDFTATVTVNSPGSASPTAPTGKVSFTDNGSPISACQNLSISSMSPFAVTCPNQMFGSTTNQSIDASYTGDANFGGSSGGVTENFSQLPTTTTVTATPSSTFGQTVMLVATVAPTSGPGNPTGSVTFTNDGTTNLGSAPLVTTAGVTTATIAITTLPVGSDAISASYGGGPGFLSSSTTTTAPVTVTKASTLLSLVGTTNPSTFGQSVTFTATISPATGSGETGTVTFLDNGSSIGTGTVSGSQATFTISTLSVGTHPITASYGGDGNFVGSSTTGTWSQVVNQAPTSVGLQSSLNPSTPGQAVTFTATITPTTGSGETGTVTFFDNGSQIGTGAVSGGTATFTTSTLSAATHPITASYGGNTNFAASPLSNTVSQVVNKVSTSVSLQSSLNPSNSGQSVTFTATVTPTSGSGETGTVTFFDNGSQIGTGAVSGGTATFTTSTLSVATHPITASYGGDGTFAASGLSNTVSQVVQFGALTFDATVVTSSANPSTVSVGVTLTADVTEGGSGGPSNFSGTVTFSDGSTVLGTSPVNPAGMASLAVPQLATATAIGTHSITAAYSGSSIYEASTSAAYSQVVAAPVYSDDQNGTNFVIANSATNAIVNTFVAGSASGSCPCGAANYLAVSPDGTNAWLMQPTATNTTLVQMNTATGAVLRRETLPIAGLGVDLKMSPSGTDLYVLMEASAATVILVVPTAPSALATLSLPVPGPPNGVPHDLAINATGTEAAVTGQNGVAFMSLPSGANMGYVADPGAEGIAFSPNGSYAYATNGAALTTLGGGTVKIMTTLTPTSLDTIVGFSQPVAVAASPDGTQLFVANGGLASGAQLPQSLEYVNLSNDTAGSFTGTLCTGGATHCGLNNITTNPSGTLVYASLYGQGDVATFNAAAHSAASLITGYPLGTSGGATTVDVYGATPPPPPPPPVTIATTTLPQATPGIWYSNVLTATNGQSPYTWALVSGTLPSGLSLAPNGYITGTPTATAATSTITVKVTDSEYPASTATATLTLPVAHTSTAPPPCGGSGTASAPGLPGVTSCQSASNSTVGGTATATSTSTAGSITVTAHGTGGLTVGQYTSAPSGGVPFRASSNSFDLALSSSNTFTSVTVVDCALAGATSLQWWNPAANGGSGAWQTVTPSTYNARTHCLTLTFSASSSPTLAQLIGTAFVGVLPAETVTMTKGGSAPYSLTGQVISGAITITSQTLVTTVSGTAIVAGATSGDFVSVTINATCILGLCSGSFAVNDPGAGVSFITPTSLTLGGVNANEAGGKGVVFPGPGLQNSYPLSWEVSVAGS